MKALICSCLLALLFLCSAVAEAAVTAADLRFTVMDESRVVIRCAPNPDLLFYVEPEKNGRVAIRGNEKAGNFTERLSALLAWSGDVNADGVADYVVKHSGLAEDRVNILLVSQPDASHMAYFLGVSTIFEARELNGRFVFVLKNMAWADSNQRIMTSCLSSHFNGDTLRGLFLMAPHDDALDPENLCVVKSALELD